MESRNLYANAADLDRFALEAIQNLFYIGHVPIFRFLETETEKI